MILSVISQSRQTMIFALYLKVNLDWLTDNLYENSDDH